MPNITNLISLGLTGGLGIGTAGRENFGTAGQFLKSGGSQESPLVWADFGNTGTLTVAALRTSTSGSGASAIISPSGDTTTGLYWTASTIGFTANGTSIGTWSSSALTVVGPVRTAVGTAAAPILTSSSATTTGFYWAAGTIGFAVAGASVGTWTAVGLTATGTISGSNLSGTNTGDQTSVSGNAGTATALQTARNINGTSFNGTADITVTAAAGTLTGATLASGVTASSLTSVGTLAALTVTATITGSVSGNAATATAFQTARTINGTSFNGTADITVTAAAGTLTGATLASGVTASSLTSVGTLTSMTTSGELFTQKGTDFTTTGSSNNVSTSGSSLIRYTGAGIATITGFANGANGKFFTFVNASASSVTINNNDSNSSAANRIITGTGVAITLLAGATLDLRYDSGASFWRVINGPTPALTDWTSFVPTGAWTANVTYTGMWRQVGDSAEYQFEVLCSGAPTTATLTFVLPTGHVIDTTKLTATTVSGSTSLPASNAWIKDAGVNNYPAVVRYSTTTAVNVYYLDDAASGVVVQGAVTQAAPFTFGASDYVTAYFTVPIVGFSSAGR